MVHERIDGRLRIWYAMLEDKDWLVVLSLIFFIHLTNSFIELILINIKRKSNKILRIKMKKKLIESTKGVLQPLYIHKHILPLI